MNETINELIKESVIKILEILSTADPVREAATIEGDNVPTQYVIDTLEVKACRDLLKRIDPGNQQLRINQLTKG